MQSWGFFTNKPRLSKKIKLPKIMKKYLPILLTLFLAGCISVRIASNDEQKQDKTSSAIERLNKIESSSEKTNKFNDE